jgi:two-component system nitrate/nitrite response regulator NarL
MLEDSLDAIEALAQQHPMVRILLLTLTADVEHVCAALKRGACGYVLKDINGSDLAQAVRLLGQGESYVSPVLAAELLTRAPPSHASAAQATDGFAHLTPREEQILSILSNGRSNKEIGNTLALSEKTIKHHVTNILQKLRVRNRVEAAILASERAPQPLSLS